MDPLTDSAERQRLTALQAFNVLDTPPEESFDRITRIAAAHYAVPTALVSLVDRDRQWFKSRVGLEACETAREISFCTHAIKGSVALIVNDASAHPVFADNPLVLGEPHIRFYAGAPLVTSQGHRIGTLCIIDHAPRPAFGASDAAVLTDLARIVVDELELRLAKQHAESTARAKADFLATMSHEIRTPMNGILGMAALLRAGDLSDEQRAHLDVLDRSGEALLRILNDILDSSKIDAGQIALEAVAFSPAEVLADTLACFAGEATAKGLSLTLRDETPDGGLLSGDPGRFRQVASNLIGNALKFTERGAVEVFCRTAEVGNGRIEARVEVADTGIGIGREALAFIFDRFTQEDNATSRRYGGSGLGLSICKKLAAMMDGRIGVESEKGKGSRFWFTIVCPRGADSTMPSETPSSTDTAIAADRDVRVLLVEDNHINQKIINFMLREPPFVVETCGGGREALQALDGGAFDVILMDIQMPEMDGLEATAEIRKRPDGNGRAPIIALTANSMDGDRERYLAGGMDDYVGKPIKPEDLLGAIKRCLERGPRDEGTEARASVS